MLNKYPNNRLFIEEYSKFVIEAKYYFTSGISQRYLAQHIEIWTRQSPDNRFKLFVQNFSDYMKKNYIDYKGNILTNVRT